MHDPVDIQYIAAGAFLGAGIIVFGACYAIFLALSRVSSKATFQRYFSLTSLGCYMALVANVIGLTFVLNLWGWWSLLSLTLLIAYFIAPRLIWRLSVAVHSDQDFSTSNDSSNHSSSKTTISEAI